MTNKELLPRISSPSIFERGGRKFSLGTPDVSDISKLVALMELNDSDTRGFVRTANTSILSRGREAVKDTWEVTRLRLREGTADGSQIDHVIDQISRQSEGIISSNFITQEVTLIKDPFNMNPVESSKTLEELRSSQLVNTLVVKENEEVVGIGRVFDVEGSTEMVSLVVHPDYRQFGIGGELIRQILQRTRSWPLYSIVDTLAESRPGSLLLDYYLRQYERWNPSIPPFEELPVALQRDLARMNDFWGSYTIIKIAGGQ